MVSSLKESNLMLTTWDETRIVFCFAVIFKRTFISIIIYFWQCQILLFIFIIVAFCFYCSNSSPAQMRVGQKFDTLELNVDTAYWFPFLCFFGSNKISFTMTNSIKWLWLTALGVASHASACRSRPAAFSSERGWYIFIARAFLK